MRRATSSVSCSLNCAGAERSALSRNSITSAVLRAGRLLVPLKITSSMPAARSDLCEVSPITQRSASTKLDLPQPFGPTTPVSPCSIWKSVGSTKDLKPSRRNLLSFIAFRAPVGGRQLGPAEPRLLTRRSGESAAFQIAPENESAKRWPQQGNFGCPARNVVEGDPRKEQLRLLRATSSRSEASKEPLVLPWRDEIECREMKA